MKELYEQLYEACKRLDSFKSDAHFVGMKGKLYDENDIRLLLVGRCVNGWESLPASSKENFATEATKQIEDLSRFEGWIEEIDGVLYSNSGSKDEPKSEKYRLSRSPFWNYTKEIYGRLAQKEKMDGIWMNNIAWTNLYKISPEEGGNPTCEQRLAQRDVCKDILLQEIKIFNPTHIIFETNIDGWLDWFEDLFPGVKRTEKRYVRAEGTYGDARACVTVRPEYKKKAAFVDEVVASLQMK